MKTRAEVEALKTSWKQDPSWDIETTEGFEDYKDELVSFSKACIAEWDFQRKIHHDKLASKMCPIMSIGYAISFGADDPTDTSIVKCFVENCAWWDEANECCGILPKVSKAL